MSLTGRDKRALRAVGQQLAPAVVIGKGGLSDPVRRQIESVLAERELIKVRLPDSQGAERKQLAAELADAVGAELAGLVGRSALLYKANPDLADAERLRW